MRKVVPALPIPCPWCGKVPRVYSNARIECETFRCPVRPRYRHPHAVSFEVASQRLMQQTIRRWNKRAVT
jgi:hypothetical protein